MFEYLTLKPQHPFEEAASRPTPRRGVRARLVALLEALVVAQRGAFDNVDPLFYRLPPI